VRILLVSQMYPGPDAPSLGSFVATLERELNARGHDVARAVVDRHGGRGRHARLAFDVLQRGRSFRPDVVYAHFLVPAGLLAAIGGGAPLVVTAHGQDVENARRNRVVRAATALTVRRAHAVVAVSAWLLDRLVEVVPEVLPKSTVIDCGVDLDRFAPQDVGAARAEIGWAPEGTGFLCIGSLSERKNVLRLARAFEHRGEGALAFVGDGPLRPALEGRAAIHLEGPVVHDRVATWISAADVVCQPSITEPFGLATLEGLAAGRSVIATRVGGPPEFVPPDAGILVDPLDDDAIATALGAAALFPRPNLAARRAAEAHDVRRQAERVEDLLLQASADRRA
jgi:glycosyltransferase involved in cell wall biosynthesis